jgi:hypothetical protein
MIRQVLLSRWSMARLNFKLVGQIIQRGFRDVYSSVDGGGGGSAVGEQNITERNDVIKFLSCREQTNVKHYHSISSEGMCARRKDERCVTSNAIIYEASY